MDERAREWAASHISPHIHRGIHPSSVADQIPILSWPSRRGVCNEDGGEGGLLKKSLNHARLGQRGFESCYIQLEWHDWSVCFSLQDGMSSCDPYHCFVSFEKGNTTYYDFFISLVTDRYSSIYTSRTKCFNFGMAFHNKISIFATGCSSTYAICWTSLLPAGRNYLYFHLHCQLQLYQCMRTHTTEREMDDIGMRATRHILKWNRMSSFSIDWRGSVQRFIWAKWSRLSVIGWPFFFQVPIGILFGQKVCLIGSFSRYICK